MKRSRFCVTLMRITKKNFFSNINTSDIAGNKTFWKTVKPFLMLKQNQNLK